MNAALDVVTWVAVMLGAIVIALFLFARRR
jgi:hypothetical protein